MEFCRSVVEPVTAALRSDLKSTSLCVLFSDFVLYVWSLSRVELYGGYSSRGKNVLTTYGRYSSGGKNSDTEKRSLSFTGETHP